MISIKSDEDLYIIQEGGQLLKRIFDQIGQVIQPGMSAFDLDQKIAFFIKELGVKPAFLGYRGYKYVSCISKNEEIVHGIPRRDKFFLPGDIVSVDVGIIFNSRYLDAARTFPIEVIDPIAQKLIDVTQQAFFEAIKFAKPGNTIGDMGHALQVYVESFGFSVVRDLCSHGVGFKLHEAPLIPNYGKRGAGVKIEKGMTFAIEPMVNIGHFNVLTLEDKWTIIAADRKWSAHYENTIFITHDGPKVLTV